MANVRTLGNKYKISSKAFLATLRYCYMYSEWKEELKEQNFLNSPKLSGMPGGSGMHGDPVASQAIRREELLKKIQKIEDTVREVADQGLYKYLLEYVTSEGMTFKELEGKGIPYGSAYFYKKRREFYCKMSKKI